MYSGVSAAGRQGQGRTMAVLCTHHRRATRDARTHADDIFVHSGCQLSVSPRSPCSGPQCPLGAARGPTEESAFRRAFVLVSADSRPGDGCMAVDKGRADRRSTGDRDRRQDHLRREGHGREGPSPGEGASQLRDLGGSAELDPGRRQRGLDDAPGAVPVPARRFRGHAGNAEIQPCQKHQRYEP